MATGTSCIPQLLYSTNGPQQGSAPFQISMEQERELDRLLADRAAKTAHIRSARAHLIIREYDTLYSDADGCSKRTDGACEYLAPDRLRVTQGEFAHIWKPDGRIWINHGTATIDELRYPADDSGYRHFGKFTVLWETAPERLRQRYYIRQVPSAEDSSLVFLEFWPRLKAEQELVQRIDLALDNDMLPQAIQIIWKGGQRRHSCSLVGLTINDGQVPAELFELPSPRKGWAINRSDAPTGRAN